MKNLVKRISSLFIVMALLVSIVVPVHAADPKSPGSITINNPSTVVKIDGLTFNAYRVLDLTYNYENQGYSYTINDKFNDILTATGYTDLKSMLAALEGMTDRDADIYAFSKKIYAAYDLGTDTPKVGADYSAVAIGETVTINIDKFGYYVVFGTASDGTNTIVAACALQTNAGADDDDNNVVINLKADAPSMEKKVYDHDTFEHDEPALPLDLTSTNWKDYADLTIGQTAYFKLNSAVPNMHGYTEYKYIVHDQMSEGLTFNNDVAVTIGGTTYTDFTVNFPAKDAANTFEIEFDAVKFKDLTAGDEIIITYSAVLNDKAVIAKNFNTNKVVLEFSNNPYEDTTGKTPEDEVRVYTFQVDLDKYTVFDADGVEEERKLAGAEFEIYKADKNGTIIGSALNLKIDFAADDDTSASIYRVSPDNGTTTTIVTPKSGLVQIVGLDEGFYILKETKAPDGYNLLEEDVHFGFKAFYPDEISFDHIGKYNPDTDEFDLTTYGMMRTVKLSSSCLVRVENNTGRKLPETGGIGRTIFTVTGSVMMVAAAVIMIAKRKTRV